MSDDYLWDRSGEVDPEVQRLEKALEGLGHQATAESDFFARLPERRHTPSPLLRTPSRLLPWLVAAALLVALGTPRSRSVWQVHSLAGRPRLVGQALETDARSEARVLVGSVGEVEVRSDTRVRLLDSEAERYRMALERGTLRATIWAPPGEFLIETPSARAVDLGCVYTLSVDNAGAGLLTVEIGWVAFEFRGRESFVPAGARCPTRRGEGPSVPYYLDAPAALRESLASLEGPTADGPTRQAALRRVLASARVKDAMTLWHLLARATGEERGLVFDRLAALVPPPSGVSRARVLAQDPSVLDAWWDELDLGSIDFWRHWEQRWPAKG